MDIKKISQILLLYIGLSILVISCRSTGEAVGEEKGTATVMVTNQGSSFSTDGILGASASLNSSKFQLVEPVQIREIPLNGFPDFKLVATLTPESSTGEISSQASNHQIIAATSPLTNPLGKGIMYKVIVFDSNGKYIKEQNFIAGSESSTPVTGLDGGSTYTFVAYSLGSSSGLADVTYSDPSNKTLTTGTVAAGSSDDLMYYSTSMTVTGNNTNYLNINFNHKYGQIVTTLDASQTGYQIVNVSNVTLSSTNTLAVMNIWDGNVTSGGQTAAVPINFPKLNSSIVIANPILVNESTTNGIFSLSSIGMKTVNGATISHTNLSLNNLKITRGVKYNLKLSFVPNDKYYSSYKGYPAVRINGFVWMRQNLGVDISTDPDTPSQSIIGDYYQWGRNKVVADRTTGPGSIPNWDSTTLPANNSWNLGNTQNPVKNTANDPCPNGWRIPTHLEYLTLNNSNAIGSDAGSVYTYASKSNPSIKLTFSKGVRFWVSGNLLASTGSYWTSSVSSGDYVYYNPGETSAISTINASLGTQVRCIADSPLGGL
ncbi:hypothetical protein VO54_01497 [Elizabethkingia miricola]|nr:hypothetical protein VO54_01497 [Elizabethkingia miricola]